jgi:hypothetical protein
MESVEWKGEYDDERSREIEEITPFPDQVTSRQRVKQDKQRASDFESVLSSHVKV